MAVYNTPSEYIEKAIDSILKQTHSNFEFIVYDDGSNQKTKDFLKVISRKDKRIALFLCNENHGLAYALNRCLEKATGSFIARMDADDYCSPNRLEKQLRYLIDEQLDVAGCDMLLFDQDGVYGSISYRDRIKNDDFLFNSPISHPTVIAKKEAFLTIGGYCEEKWCLRNEDYNLFMRMQSAGFKMGNINEPLYYFREDADAVKRRQFKYRINEYKVRKNGFHLLKLYPRGFFYKWKPLLVGLLPKKMYLSLRKRKTKSGLNHS